MSPLPEAASDDVSALATLIAGRRVLVVSGAGISTESGIPDYRSPRAEPRRAPIRFQEFIGDPAVRKRYWARSTVGWQRVARAKPNSGHHALAQLETSGPVQGVITQNVDGLHQQAGSQRVLDLHGSLAWVRCMDCADAERRHDLQRRLVEANPELSLVRAPFAPDGDADLASRHLADMRVPGCRRCGGLLKPDVVFFGENVPKSRVAEAWSLFEDAEVLLVLGSSLAVFSGYRFVLRASKEGIPIGIVNDGPTRGDDHASVRVAGRLGSVLPALVERLRS